MVKSSNLGFPRIGAMRELKKAVESFWKGNLSETELLSTAKGLRKTHWQLQKDAGIEIIPSNDFSFYDQVLDTIAHVGAIPERYNFDGGQIDLTTYFAMARGLQKDGEDVTAMEMSKWFDTNYHYIVPEFSANQDFILSSNKIIDEYLEAKELGIETRPVLLGPVSLLKVGKAKDGDFDPISLLPRLLPVYKKILAKLEEAGVQCLQIDEPCLVLDLDTTTLDAYKAAYEELSKASNVKLLLATYFGDLKENADVAFGLPVDGFHIDLVRAPAQLDSALNKISDNAVLSVGVIDGRNVWRANLEESLAVVNKAVEKLGSDRVLVAASCSLLHTPVDLDSETSLDAEVKTWLAFGKQKLYEIAQIADAANGNKDEAVFADNSKAAEARKTSSRIHNDAVKQRVTSITEDMKSRKSDYKVRADKQRPILNLPLLPTTTIGSFPQTTEVRQARAKFKKGELSREAYDKFLEEETVRTIKIQEDLGLDVLVHGEFERNDMVEYFGEKLSGFVFSKFGWVQSYGSRCVKPPIIFGDVSRDEPMTVRWAKFSQENSTKLMKGMLTGPVTILQWSFVRNDQPESTTCEQIGLAIRDEVVDLEKAGIKVIQIDEAALREGLPLRRSEWQNYLDWAVGSFRVSASGVQDETQIHTHMCYSEFNDIIAAVADMDADVISVETSRSQMELLDAFVDFKYPNEIGPGVYDIHSPRVPNQEEMENLLYKALKVLSPEQVWVNPDCGLKTRGWPEVNDSLEKMVNAAIKIREEIENGTLKQSA